MVSLQGTSISKPRDDMNNQMKSDGSFMPYHAEFRKLVAEKDFQKFSGLKTNYERFAFIRRLENDLTCEDDSENGGKLKRVFAGPSTKGKDLEKALLLKEKGNAAFGKGDWSGALHFYNKSYLLTPQGSTHHAVILSNRSAALYRSGHYVSALQEADRAQLTRALPENTLYKLLDRSARCHLARGDHDKALEAFRRTLQVLDDAKLPLEKRHKLQTDVQIMIKMLEKTKRETIKSKSQPKDDRKKESLLDRPKKTSAQYPGASDAVAIVTSEQDGGRHAVATRDVTVGQVLVTEEPHACALLAEMSAQRCQCCFRNSKNPLACPLCPNVVFCSSTCMDQSRCFHDKECAELDALWSSGCSLTCLLAFRMIAQKPLEYFLDIRKQLLKNDYELIPYNGSDYRTIYKLVSHERERKPDDLFHRSLMASFLARCLEKAGYFRMSNDAELDEYVTFIGSLVLHNLQVCQFNAHEVSELRDSFSDFSAAVGDKKQQNSSETKSRLIGGAVYPTLALFNHACDPALVRYFRGTRVVARCVRPLKAGDEIPENYGPIYTREVRESRRFHMRQQYWFDCNCQACREDWPRLEDMPPSILRFRCQSKTSGNDCNNVIPVAEETAEFMIKCGNCQQFTNILKGLKSLQDTDELFKQAARLLNNGQHEEAFKKYVTILNLLHATLAPPFKDYNLCQQGLRSCMLRMGNRAEIDEPDKRNI